MSNHVALDFIEGMLYYEFVFLSNLPTYLKEMNCTLKVELDTESL